LNRTFSISFLLLFFFNTVVSQSIIKEGRGIDSLTLGIHESKVIAILGNNFQRKPMYKIDHVLIFPEKHIRCVVDEDNVVFEIIIDAMEGFETAKGLKIKKGLTIQDIEAVYGEDWWTSEEYGEVGFDIGIRFEMKNDKVYQIVIEESDLEDGNDYSFYEYIEGTYIPKDLEECFEQLNLMLKPNTIEEIKSKTEEAFSSASHFGLGLWMRNNWGLWKSSRLYLYFKEKGIFHPDDMSGIILDSYHRKLNGKEIELEKQIEKYQEYWKQQQKN
jgi:hypothetical protein